MKNKTNAGFSAILLIVLIAIIGGGAYYLGVSHAMNTITYEDNGKSTTTVSTSETEEVSPISITPPSSDKIEIKVESNKKTYTSNISNVSFEYPSEWYVYEKLKHAADFTFLTSPTRPKDEEPCDCDKNYYGALARIDTRDLQNTEEESKAKNFDSSLYYKGINQKTLDAENTKRASEYAYADAEAKKFGVRLGVSFLQTTGTKIIRSYSYGEMHSTMAVIYYVYLGDTVYIISSSGGSEFSKEKDEVLKNIALSLKSTK